MGKFARAYSLLNVNKLTNLSLFAQAQQFGVLTHQTIIFDCGDLMVHWTKRSL